MMNGAGHQGYMQMNMGHKYQQQNHQQHHGQQNQHHHQSHVGGHGGAMGHQHTFSSGTMSNATPQFANTGLHNGSATLNSQAIDETVPEHWARQLQLAAEGRQNAGPHVHAKKDGVLAMTKGPQQSAEDNDENTGEERNRAMINNTDSRQHWTSLDLSGQGLRMIATSLFEDYRFLTRLFLDHNALAYLSTAIGQLRHLIHLNVSGNKLLALPPEIGMLSNLKELLLFDNQIRGLPAEIGLLFKLELLGIEGNDHLDEEQRNILMNDGTKALVHHLREQSHGKSPSPQLSGSLVQVREIQHVLTHPSLAGPAPIPRPWRVLDVSPAAEIISVLSYNILCDKYATHSQYGYTPSQALSWERRSAMILDEVKDSDADFVCLQEVDMESYNELFRRELAYKDYKGAFWPKSRAKTMSEREARLVDGCATFYKSSKYICLGKDVVDFAHLAINRPDMKGEHDVFNRVMPKDNIAIVAFFENRQTGSRIIVANAHIHWDPLLADVKLVQVAILMEQIGKFADKWAKHPPCTDKTAFRHSEVDDESKPSSPERASTPAPSVEYGSGTEIPLLVCGDFNSGAESGVYQLLTEGSVPPDHCEFGDHKYGNFTREGTAHQFSMKSAYTGDAELQFTNYTPNFQGMIDYIWYSANVLQVRGVLGHVDEEYLRKVPGFPHWHFPSDHLAIKAEFSVKPRKERR